MPTVTHRRELPVPVSVLWGYVQDLSNWAEDIPGYVQHREIGTDESVWTVRGDLGALNKQVDFRVTVTERLEPERVVFSLQGINEQVSGQGAFEARDLTIDPTPRGPRTSPSVTRRRSWYQRLIRWLCRRTFAQVGEISPPAAPSAAVKGASEFSFTLTLAAGGMMGPVVNALLDPLLEPAAVELADKVALAVEASGQGA